MGEAIRADIIRNWRQTSGSTRARLVAMLTSQGLWAVAAYRFGRWAYGGRRSTQRLARPVYALMFKTIEIAAKIRLPARADIGPGLCISNIGPIIVSPDARIGCDCTIANDVTIGVVGRGAPGGAPRIGDGVTLGPGAKVIGPVVIGSGAVVCANSVVVKNVPAGARAAGVPARLR